MERRDGYRVIIGGPVPPQADAVTLGNTIVVRKRAAQHQGLMAHELVHVRQFKELGLIRFGFRYVGSYLRFRLSGYGHMASYRRIPLEVEASWISRLHGVRELEPNAAALRDRLAQGQRRSLPTVPRPAPNGGTWNRPRQPKRLKAVQAAMASRDAISKAPQ